MTSSGLALARTMAAADVGPVDTLVVAGADLLAEQSLGEELLAVAAVLAERTPRVASVCSGAFVLAALGLLDGRRATTHWRHAKTLARRYPRVRVEADALHIRTAGTSPPRASARASARASIWPSRWSRTTTERKRPGRLPANWSSSCSARAGSRSSPRHW